MPVYKPLRVNTETISQIDQLTQISGCSAREVIEKAVEDQWNKKFAEIEESISEELVLTAEDNLPIVYPKPQYKKYLETLTDASGPYSVLKLSSSWAGYSEGIYQLEGCPVPVPVSWFDANPPKKQPLVVTTPVFFVAWLIVQIIMQVGFFVLFI